ncbi:MAG: CopG family ribbon-helix-helix protein [Candidatus Geothermarchaeales archaeon]
MIVSVSIPEALLRRVDESAERRGFASRSEIIRQALRYFMAEYEQLDRVQGSVIATVTITYRKEREKPDMLGAHHAYSGIVYTFLHAHVDEQNCLEVLVVKGGAEKIRRFVESLLAREEVIQVKTSILGPATPHPSAG